VRIIENNYRFSACPFCGAADLSKVGNLKYAKNLRLATTGIQLTQQPELWKCNLCQSSFTQNAIPPAVAEELYAGSEGSQRWGHESFEKDKTDAVIDYFKKNEALRDKKLLDVGCNTGEFLDFVKTNGIQPYGLEICEESHVILKNKGYTSYRSPGDISGMFDIITLFDTMEHLYDPKGFLRLVDQLLNSGGLLIVLTGNPMSAPVQTAKQRWWYYNYPEHVIFPSQNYFYHYLEGYTVKQFISTYASRTQESLKLSFKQKIRSYFGAYRRNQYNGAPDHQFVVLVKK
jgi:2-polyprenyl-3-methyl-5-hydroxy-6-metoxy-1,4-benzoquinol methylase